MLSRPARTANNVRTPLHPAVSFWLSDKYNVRNVHEISYADRSCSVADNVRMYCSNDCPWFIHLDFILTCFRLEVNNLFQVIVQYYWGDIMYRRIRDLREDNDLTQKKVAEMLGMSQTGYSKYETGENDIPTGILIKLARLYNTSIDYLLGETDNPNRY